jgi:2-deoxy-D-gluconate 3-dehydrogenase
MPTDHSKAFDLTDRVAVVTGGNGGIGLGMARGLASHGAKLVIAARNPTKNDLAVAELHALGAEAEAIPVDVADETSCNALIASTVERFGRVDVLVNNAGTNVRKPPEELTLDEWRLVLDTNLTSAFMLSKAVYPHMKAQGGGKIINTGSMMSLFGSSFAAAYAASKGGIVQFTKSCALSWAPANIQVNAILPGWITTELTERAQTEVPGLYERVLGRIPTGRWGNWDDMAGVAIFLASPASDYVTGTAIPVDGGYAAQG